MTWPLALICGFAPLLAGCETQKTLPMGVPDHRQILVARYSRIDIQREDLAQGLHELFDQLVPRLGLIQIEPIVKDYSPMIRQALSRRVYCSVQKLNINGTPVDIDIYFRTDQTQPILTIDAYLEGSASPYYTVLNRYHQSQ